jgi:hypothetical protein
MKLLRLSAWLIVVASVPMNTLAQDGWLLSATPPIVVRFDGEFRFTNTSDKPIHGVTLHSTKDGQTTSRVIIDTIEPHKTVSVDARISAEVLNDGTITCANYSKPMKVPFP